MTGNRELDSFYKELLNDFKTESAEHYQTIEQGLFKLVPGDTSSTNSVIETIYRSTHSLKGAARAVSLFNIEKVCSALESVFAKIKNNEIKLSSSLLETLQDFTTLLRELLLNTDESEKSSFKSKISRAEKNLNYVTEASENKEDNQDNKEEPESEKEPVESSKKRTFDEETIKPDLNFTSVRISTEHLNTILTQTESFVVIKNNLEHYRRELKTIYENYSDPQILNLLKELTDFQSTVIRMTDDLTTNVRNALLSSFDTLLKLLPRMVRDLSKEYSKKINLKTEGAFVEIDRRILEELKDPLIHLLRNSIDHGIEKPEEREKTGKKREGTISIQIKKMPEQTVKVIIEDDGIGIDKNKIIESALKKGIISLEESKSICDSEVYNLIFQSGVSSTKFVTDISGRGLGMSIVAEKIANLGGTIETESRENYGTKFTISLPQTITTFRGILVTCSNQDLIIPSHYIQGIKRANQSDIITIGNKTVITDNSGNRVGLVKLSTVLGLENAKRSSYREDFFYLLYLSYKNNTTAYIVDSICQEYEGVLKNMGPQLTYAKNILGVTTIKNEIVVPVIDVKELIENTILDDSLSRNRETTSIIESKESKVLIVEDSITIRSMLRNMVEGAGYQVITANDGLDALNKIEDNYFDIIVSDIEMPHLNGFELTRKIKATPTLKEIPVILVTALDSPLDMKKGMDSGADAYIVKSNFEKSNLIETIKRLL